MLTPPPTLLLRGFFFDHNLQMRGHVFVQLDWYHKLADGFQGFVKLDLAAIEIESLLLQRFGNIARGHRTKQLFLLAGPPLE